MVGFVHLSPDNVRVYVFKENVQTPIVGLLSTLNHVKP